MPLSLSELYSTGFDEYGLDDLRNVIIDFSITEEEQVTVQVKSVEQNKSHLLFKFRAGRITASQFRAACCTSHEKPSLSLLKGICYPAAVLFKTTATDYGLKHEDIARREYENVTKKNHVNFVVKVTGFIISLDNPIFGASPDGLISCDCCGDGCLELKCPYKMHNEKMSLKSFAAAKNTCLILEEDGSYSLDKKHAYCYQVQLQMYVTKRKYSDFVIWSKNEIWVERIVVDNDFLQKNLLAASTFHSSVIIPELLSRWYTNSRECVQVELLCECQKPDDGQEMIRCANELCYILAL